MSSWFVRHVTEQAIVVSNGVNDFQVQVRNAAVVWDKVSNKLPREFKRRVSAMALARKYLTCDKNMCVHHKAKARGGVVNVCGLKNAAHFLGTGGIAVNTGFWLGPEVVGCVKFEHEISRM
jgi:hypothetical protein